VTTLGRLSELLDIQRLGYRWKLVDMRSINPLCPIAWTNKSTKTIYIDTLAAKAEKFEALAHEFRHLTQPEGMEFIESEMDAVVWSRCFLKKHNLPMMDEECWKKASGEYWEELKRRLRKEEVTQV